MSEDYTGPLQVEEIPFNPLNKTGWEKEDGQINEVVIRGERKPVHPTNNLRMIFGFHKRLISGDRTDPFMQVYKGVFQTNRLGEILEHFGKKFPLLYARMSEISEQHYQNAQDRNNALVKLGPNSPEYETFVKKQGRTVEEAVEQDYIFSMGYDGLAESAVELDPEYPVENLRVLTGYNG
ncbi:hypothetical protein HYW35_03510 [Candidatus Saccharibacteria bacterium]|nr:hypothetical protein [Candidatus Saccharibacteria bacterium]